MCLQPVARMLAGMAVGAQVFFYSRGVLDIRMAVIAGNLIICNMVLMHETEIIVFFNPFPDIVT